MLLLKLSSLVIIANIADSTSGRYCWGANWAKLTDKCLDRYPPTRSKNLENIDSAVMCMLDEIGIFNYTREILAVDNWISFFKPGVTNTKYFDNYQKGVYLCEEKVNVEYNGRFQYLASSFMAIFYLCVDEYVH